MHPKINRKFAILSQTFAVSKGINRANMKTKRFNGKNAGDRSFKNIANDLKKKSLNLFTLCEGRLCRSNFNLSTECSFKRAPIVFALRKG